jgi:hypothetical protein
MAAATTSSPKVSPHHPGLVGCDDHAGPLVAGGDELEEQVRGFGLELSRMAGRIAVPGPDFSVQV